MQTNPSEIFKHSKNLLFEKIYIIPLLLTSILSYAYTLFNFVPGIDDLATGYYLTNGLPSQGRFTNTLLSVFSGFWESFAFAQDFIAVCILILATVYMSICFYVISNKRINIISLSAFSCFFISCPLISEIFMFCGASFNFAIGSLLVCVAAVQGYNGVHKKSFKNLLLSVAIMTILASLYEAFFAVYAILITFIFITDYIYNPHVDKNTAYYFKKGIVLCVVLLLAIVAEYIISNSLIKLFDIEVSTYLEATLSPRYFSQGFVQTFFIMLKEVAAYHISGFWNFPVTVINICLLMFFVFAVIALIKTKKLTLPLLFICAIVCYFLMSIVLGGQAKPRTLESMYVGNAFAVLLLTETVIKFKLSFVKKAFLAAVCIIVIWQGSYMTKLFYYEDVKFRAECRTIEKIYHTVEENFDTSKKPVIWVGSWELTSPQKDMVFISDQSAGYAFINKVTSGLADELYDPQNTGYVTARNAVLSRSTINWMIDGLRGHNTELYTYFDYLGLDYIPASEEMYNEAKKISENMPSWNNNGCIKETEEYIIVKLK